MTKVNESAKAETAAENRENAAADAGAEAPVKPDKKMVRIKLFKDSTNYKDDVFVSVNGENYLIQRGVEVEVPDYIAEVLKHSETQDMMTAMAIEKAAAKAAKME